MRRLLATAAIFTLGLFLGWIVGSRQSPVRAEGSVPPVQTIPNIPALGAAIPKFGGIIIHFAGNFEGASVGPSMLRLDGLEAVHNRWDNPAGVTFLYGGGAYKLEDALIRGPVTLELDGAAANTASLLQLFGIIGRPPYTATPPPSMAVPAAATGKNNKVVTKTLVKKPGYRGDLSSRYDSQK